MIELRWKSTFSRLSARPAAALRIVLRKPGLADGLAQTDCTGPRAQAMFGREPSRCLHAANWLAGLARETCVVGLCATLDRATDSPLVPNAGKQ